MKQNKLADMKMSKLVVNMSLPLMASLLIQSLYNIVDSIFVARISEKALTAVSLVFPVQLLLISVGVGTAVGVNALLSRSIGAKKYDQTKKIATTGLILSVISMFFFIAFGIFLTDHFVQMFTSDTEIAVEAGTYLRICMLFCGGSLLSTMYQRFLQSTGDTFRSMISLIAGALTNLILDPILIFGVGFIPSFGISGAAIATVIGQWISAITAVILNKRYNPGVQPALKGFQLEKDIVLKIYKVGLPTIITQALGSVMVSAVNAVLITYSTTAVAFFGIYYKLQSFLFMPMNGLGQAAIPIAGFNYGAKNYQRIVEMLKLMITFAAAVALIMTVIFMCFPDRLLALFQSSDEMLMIGIPALRIISCTFIFASITMIIGYTVSGLGNGIVNMIATALRQVVILIPLIALIASNLTVSYVWYAFWVSELITCLYAMIHGRMILKQKGILYQPQTAEVI